MAYKSYMDLEQVVASKKRMREMKVNGRLSALIEIRAGFRGGLTGRKYLFKWSNYGNEKK